MGSTPDTLAKWLVYLEQIHPESVEMGLERVKRVKDKLELWPSFPLIVVSGTNGKGSVCAMLETMLTHAGYHVGCYTSPHLIRYNERIRIDQQEASDDIICQAFEEVELARVCCRTSLTYFEFGTLAALYLFIQARVEVAILEVGLGGRLDAVNVFDAECAILTSIGLDHVNYLGATREKIGFEKAGIFRKQKTAICSEPDVPETISHQAKTIGSNFLQIGKDFGYTAEKMQWRFWGVKGNRHCLPYPALRGAKQLQNASACLAALDMLKACLPTHMKDIRHGLLNVLLPGRFQVLPGQPLVVLDVAHNPDAAHVLATNLDAMGSYHQTYAVFSMLIDKDIAGVVQALKHCVDVWLVSPIHTARSASVDELVEALDNAGVTKEKKSVYVFSDSIAAYVFACEHATKNDRICVLGSFHTVSVVLRYYSAGTLMDNTGQ